MNNIKYHILNTVGMIIFSMVMATSVNSLIRYSISPLQTPKEQHKKRILPQNQIRNLDHYYTPILESGFFKIASAQSEVQSVQTGQPSDFELVGTVTGPREIALAMIRKKGEPEPGIYSLAKRSTGISNDVYGYTLIQISDKYVKLRLNSQDIKLELYHKDEPVTQPQSQAGPESSQGQVSRNISRAEMQQKVLNNMDNALKGLTAGPHRVNNQITGYRIIRLQPYNILYQYGARTGDVITRINGNTLDSTEKLYRMWELIKSESQIRIDLERAGKPLTFNFTITD